MSLKYHPDKQSRKTDDEKKKAEAQFKIVNNAYDILKNHQDRFRKKCSQQQQEQDEIDRTRHRSDDNRMKKEDLLLAGMYNLTPQQRNAYQLFVHMLIEHDTTDQLRIIEDAFKDAQVESLLNNFSGT